MNGAYKETPLLQVQYGGMCAYLIKEEDKEIHEPIARIAIKRFVGRSKKSFIFLAENRVYGDYTFANELNFGSQVKSILHKSNLQTNLNKNIAKFTRNDDDSYSDSFSNETYFYDLKSFDDKTPEQLRRVNWDKVSQQTELPIEFIREYKDYLNWSHICKCQTLTEDLIDEFAFRLTYTNWRYISEYQKLSEKMIAKYANKVDWYYITLHQKLSPAFIKRFQDEIHWEKLAGRKKLSEQFIKQFYHKIPMKHLAIHNGLSNEFIIDLLKNKNLPIENIIMFNTFNYYPEPVLEYIIDHKDELTAHIGMMDDLHTIVSEICRKASLSEAFLEKYIDYVNWAYVASEQNISKKFISKYEKYLMPEAERILELNEKISPDVKQFVRDLLPDE